MPFLPDCLRAADGGGIRKGSTFDGAVAAVPLRRNPSFRQSEPTFELRHEDVVGVTDTDIPLAGLGVTTHFSTTQRDHCLTCGRGPVRGMRV